MKTVAFLGLGAMGSRMAGRLLTAGYSVTVWNRTPDRAGPLIARGARASKTPKAAAEGADAVVSMLRDDAAGQAVWLDRQSGALTGMAAGALAVECSTVTPSWARRLAAACADNDISFADAPLAGSRPQAEAGQLIFFAGGDADTVTRARPLLDAMGQAVHTVGPTGSGAAVKLMVNALFGAQLAMLGEAIALLERAGVSTAEAIQALSATPVCSPAAAGAAMAMQGDAFPPAFPIDLVAKDFDLFARTGAEFEIATPLGRAVGGVYRAAAEAGFAGDNITGIIQAFRTGGPFSSTTLPSGSLM